MSYTVLIPARLASTRLPNKPLAEIAGVPIPQGARVFIDETYFQAENARYALSAIRAALSDAGYAISRDGCCLLAKGNVFRAPLKIH